MRRSHYFHKRTFYCPVSGCNYTSRKMITGPMDNKLSSHSEVCSKHRQPLVQESEKKAIENKDVAYCNFNGCEYTQKHDDGSNICPEHKHKLSNSESLI